MGFYSAPCWSNRVSNLEKKKYIFGRISLQENMTHMGQIAMEVHYLKKIVFLFATLTANCGQVFNEKKTSNPYISELVLGCTPQKYKSCFFENLPAISCQSCKKNTYFSDNVPPWQFDPYTTNQTKKNQPEP